MKHNVATSKTNFQAQKGEGAAPLRAHMALQTGAMDGDADSLLAIPEGAHLFFIEDPAIPSTIIECLLEKVIYENHQFKGLRMVVRGETGTRRLHLTAAWTGNHSSKLQGQTNASAQRVAEAGDKVEFGKKG